MRKLGKWRRRVWCDDQIYCRCFKTNFGFLVIFREAIEEDAEGLLDTAIAEIIEKSRRKRLEERRAAGQVRLGIMRHLYVILDLSNSMLDQDLKPNRILCTLKVFNQDF